jgi:hypothetical protein
MNFSAVARSGFKFTVAVFVFLITIEICARVDDALRYGAPLWGEYTANCLKSKDSEGIPYNVPKARFEKWQNNTLGFRGPEITLIKPTKTLRVVCLGASESYGLYESPGKEWPAQLRDLLRTTHYQVINASVVGLTVSSYEAYLQKYVLPLHPDIIICFVNPFFYATSFEKTQELPMAPTKPASKVPVKSPIALIKRIISNARCLPKIKQVVKKALQHSFPKELQRYQVWNLRRQVAAAESVRLGGRKPKDTVSDASVTRFKKDLSALVSFLEQRHVKVMLSTYPSLMGRDNLSTYPEQFLDNRRFFVEFSLKGMSDVLEKYNSVVSEVAVERGALLIDCQHLVPKTDEYFGDNVHYTDRGARQIAEGIAKELLGKPDVMIPSVAGRDTKCQ